MGLVLARILLFIANHLILISILFVAFTTLFFSLVVRFLPILFAPRSFKNTPDHDRKRIKKLWRQTLKQKKSMSIHTAVLWMNICFLVGFSGAWFSVPADTFISYLLDEWYLNHGMYFEDPMPRPVIGWFTYSDGTWVAIGIMLITYFLIVIPARKRLAASKPLARRWCKDCGYPIGTIKSKDPLKVCPECGNESS